jgi:hypothetical protein
VYTVTFLQLGGLEIGKTEPKNEVIYFESYRIVVHLLFIFSMPYQFQALKSSWIIPLEANYNQGGEEEGARMHELAAP